MGRLTRPAALLLSVPGLLLSAAAGGAEAIAAVPEAVRFERDFAPAEGWAKPVEQPQRLEVCLNGRWQFQPIVLPPGFKREAGNPPALPLPAAGGWDAVPIKVPSPWNVNTWGGRRRAGAGTEQPYDPSALYFPSYPESWDGADMGWLRRTFSVPADWAERRVVLHFEAVAGDCQVLVNGQPAGEHFDKYLPFELDVTKLMKRDAENELLVGVRAHALFNKRSAVYPKMRAPYPCGSETERLVGIWQDVFLLSLPAVRISDVFVKPLVDQDALELDVTVRNDTDRERTVTLGGSISPWLNLAGKDTLTAPEPNWKLGEAAMALPAKEVSLKPGATMTVTLREAVAQRLQLWAPGTPNLYAAVLTLTGSQQQTEAARGTQRTEAARGTDRHYTRFGWRQFRISGKDLLLNGQKIQLCGDLLHPFGPYIMSRRFVWAWYRMIQDFGGNAVRPHAQIHPRHYLDLADEMGIVVLDETALFGSSIALNFEEPVAWQRFAEHYDGLVLRDRNHPSVAGWSFGNELFAIFNLNQVSKADTDRWYAQLAELGLRVRKLDPTREWTSCDGDDDLRGTLPVWSKHFGHGTPLDRLPDVNKPLMVGESGGTYYATPGQLAAFNGERAYESYAGRNEALAIDVYDNIAKMARPRLAYYSASETAWFGIEHLTFGYRDFTRLPDARDGVFFVKPFQEGKPGMQLERLPPYVATLNPGWDSGLPLYKPLAMFEAQKAALAKDGPQACPWDHRAAADERTRAANSKQRLPVAQAVEQVGFLGDRAGGVFSKLAALGVPFADADAATSFLVVAGDGLDEAAATKAKADVGAVLDRGGTAFVMVGEGTGETPLLQQLLPAPVQLTNRQATALLRHGEHPWVANLGLAELYFAEETADRFILKRGLAGLFVEKGRVLLAASNTDWSLFNNRPETVKCAAEVLYEQLVKPGGAALVEHDSGKGKLVLCALDWRINSRTADALWRKLLANMGIRLRAARDAAPAAFDEKGVLINALSIGRFGAADVDAAMARDFLGNAAAPPKKDGRAAGLAWLPLTCPSRDRFVLNELQQEGPQDVFAVYFSYWIKSPRALDDLLSGGPDAPRLTMLCYVAEKCRLFLNGQELSPARTEPADYRMLYAFDGLPLKKGWNHFLIKVASSQFGGERPGTLAVRISSNSANYCGQLETAVELDAAQK